MTTVLTKLTITSDDDKMLIECEKNTGETIQSFSMFFNRIPEDNSNLNKDIAKLLLTNALLSSIDALASMSDDLKTVENG